MAESGWLAVRPSGTKDIYRIYAKSSRARDPLDTLVDEARRIIGKPLGGD